MILQDERIKLIVKMINQNPTLQELQVMIAEAVLGKRHLKPTSSEKIKTVLRETIGDKVADNHISHIFERINDTFAEWNAAGPIKTRLLKEKLRERLKQYGVFKFSDATLEQFIDIFMSRTLNIYCAEVDKAGELYKAFLDNIVNQVSNSLTRCLNDETKVWGIHLEETHPDNTVHTYLAVILIEVDEFIWIPATPDRAELENNEELKRSDFTSLFRPLYEMIFPTKKDRGLVRVNGPRGGEHLCGEIYSPKKRDEYTEGQKTIQLSNGYSMSLFVKK
jgi:hypothetical protein